MQRLEPHLWLAQRARQYARKRDDRQYLNHGMPCAGLCVERYMQRLLSKAITPGFAALAADDWFNYQ